MRRQLQLNYGRLWQRIGGQAMARAHVLDVLVASLSRRSKIFSAGWGDEGFLAKLPYQMSHVDSGPAISLTWHATARRNAITQREGTFPSPLAELPAKVRTAHLRAWLREGNRNACVILAASSDEGYGLRERVFGTLAERGIDLFFLENPFYFTVFAAFLGDCQLSR